MCVCARARMSVHMSAHTSVLEENSLGINNRPGRTREPLRMKVARTSSSMSQTSCGRGACRRASLLDGHVDRARPAWFLRHGRGGLRVYLLFLIAPGLRVDSGLWLFCVFWGSRSLCEICSLEVAPGEIATWR